MVNYDIYNSLYTADNPEPIVSYNPAKRGSLADVLAMDAYSMLKIKNLTPPTTRPCFSIMPLKPLPNQIRDCRMLNIVISLNQKQWKKL